MKIKTIIGIWGLLFVSQQALASTLVLSHYPTNSETKKLLNSTVNHIVLESFYSAGHTTARVGYPGNQDLKNLNKLDMMDIEIYLDAGSYPSTNARKRLNKLGNHISLDMVINQCLTSNTNEKKLAQITKKANVTIYCPTSKSYIEAEERVIEIEKNNKMPNLNISVEIVPGFYPF